MIYKTYFPHISSPRLDPKKGLCMAYWHPYDVEKLACSWWYDWGITVEGMSDPKFVPMSWSGSSSLNLLLDYSGYLLILNEPEGRLQSNLTSEQGATRVLAIAEKFPQAKLIVGGTGRWSGDWISRFKTMLGEYKPHGYHIHYYIESDINTIQDFRDYINGYRDSIEGELWLSEFGDPIGNGIDLMQAVREAPLDRYAWFANRVDITQWYWPSNWPNDMSLINKDGELTEYGKNYKGDT